MEQPANSFTVTGNTLEYMLRSECAVSLPWDSEGGAPRPPRFQFTAVWDTGSTGCAITKAVVDQCQLENQGTATTFHTGGVVPVDEFIVNLWLPSGTCLAGVSVALAELHGVADVLIGMDVINQGDFAVTNLNGRTKFSFRVPSLADIDFVEEAGLNAQPHDDNA